MSDSENIETVPETTKTVKKVVRRSPKVSATIVDGDEWIAVCNGGIRRSNFCSIYSSTDFKTLQEVYDFDNTYFSCLDSEGKPELKTNMKYIKCSNPDDIIDKVCDIVRKTPSGKKYLKFVCSKHFINISFLNALNTIKDACDGNCSNSTPYPKVVRTRTVSDKPRAAPRSRAAAKKKTPDQENTISKDVIEEEVEDVPQQKSKTVKKSAPAPVEEVEEEVEEVIEAPKPKPKARAVKKTAPVVEDEEVEEEVEEEVPMPKPKIIRKTVVKKVVKKPEPEPNDEEEVEEIEEDPKPKVVKKTPAKKVVTAAAPAASKPKSKKYVSDDEDDEFSKPQAVKKEKIPEDIDSDEVDEF